MLFIDKPSPFIFVMISNTGVFLHFIPISRIIFALRFIIIYFL